MIRIVIASVMKPADEVRMYKRIATSLSKTNKYDINIIGIESKNTSAPIDNIRFHLLSRKGRHPIARIKNLIKVQKIISQLEPAIVIVTSPDLLFFVTRHRSRQQFRVVYDLQEDYLKNIINQRIYPRLLRAPLAYLVRSIEQRSVKYVDYIWLAEKIYKEDISYCRNYLHTTVLENKYHGICEAHESKVTAPIRLIFSGTISAYSGIHHAIKIHNELTREGYENRLVVIGICHDRALQNQLKKISLADSSVELIGITKFVDHDRIIAEIRKSSIAIVGYEPNPVNRNKMPSKVYEYTALNIPCVADQRAAWSHYLSRHNLCITVDFQHISAKEIMQRYQSLRQIPQETPANDALWVGEEYKLFNSIKYLIN